MSEQPTQQTPPGPYAHGARSPIVWVRLCASCAGYAPYTPEAYNGALSGGCAGCGAWSRETHRFPAHIDSSTGCSCGTHGDPLVGDLQLGSDPDGYDAEVAPVRDYDELAERAPAARDTGLVGFEAGPSQELTCGRCQKPTGNSNQGHYWAHCKAERRLRTFHFCCPGDCQLATPEGVDEVLAEQAERLAMVVAHNAAEVDRLTAERDEAVNEIAEFTAERHQIENAAADYADSTESGADLPELVASMWDRIRALEALASTRYAERDQARADLVILTTERDRLLGHRAHDEFFRRGYITEIGRLHGMRHRVLVLADEIEARLTADWVLESSEQVLVAALGAVPVEIRAAVDEPATVHSGLSGQRLPVGTQAKVLAAIAAGRVGCVLTEDGKAEYWPDCDTCQGTGGVGTCPTCEIGPASQCDTCGGLGKVRPASPPPFRHANGEPCHGCRTCLDDGEAGDGR